MRRPALVGLEAALRVEASTLPSGSLLLAGALSAVALRLLVAELVLGTLGALDLESTLVFHVSSSGRLSTRMSAAQNQNGKCRRWLRVALKSPKE